MSTGRKPIAPALRGQIRTFSADQAFWRDCADLSHVAHLPARTRWTLALEMDGRTRDGQPLLVAINVAPITLVMVTGPCRPTLPNAHPPLPPTCSPTT